MKKIAFTTILLVLGLTPLAMAAGEEAYTFGQALQTLVRQQQSPPANGQDAEKLYFLPDRPKGEKSKEYDKSASQTGKSCDRKDGGSGAAN